MIVFEDGTAVVDGVEADAIGGHGDLPFLSEQARLATVRGALAEDDRSAAEAAVDRGILSVPEGDAILVTFVAPPDWERFGPALWDPVAGTAHAVFTAATMLVGGVAVLGCVGRPFADEGARRACAGWCIRNGLDDLAARVGRTPVGGDGPHCTWPEVNMESAVSDPEPSRQTDGASSDTEDAEGIETHPDRVYELSNAVGSTVVNLFGELVRAD